MRRLTQRLLKCRKGAAMVEYALIVAGVALIGAASTAIFGHKTNDMIAMTAAILPGAHVDDNAPIVSGKIIETTNTGGSGGNAITLDVATIVTNSGTERLGNNLGSNALISTLVVEP
jgi:pilus assembly protein Flp/PilA